MGITVYGATYSTCTLRVLAVLEEKKVPYEIKEIDLMEDEHKTPGFLRLQPFGKIPALTDGDLTLFESRAIMRMIANKFEVQGAPLFGSTLEEKALVEQWLEVEAQNFQGPASGALHQALFGPIFSGITTDKKVLSAHLAKLEKVLDVYEKRLKESKFLAGDFFSLADLAHLPQLHYLIRAAKKERVLEGRPAVTAWWEDIAERPVWKKLSRKAAQAAAI